MTTVASEVTSIDGSRVTVKMEKVKSVPDSVVEIRARTRALVAKGMFNSVGDALSDITNTQELERMTDIISNSKKEESMLTETRSITVEVNP